MLKACLSGCTWSLSDYSTFGVVTKDDAGRQHMRDSLLKIMVGRWRIIGRRMVSRAFLCC